VRIRKSENDQKLRSLFGWAEERGRKLRTLFGREEKKEENWRKGREEKKEKERAGRER
jgi:hypothetical protein